MKKYVYILLLLASVSTLATAQIKIGNYTFKDGGEYTGELKGRKPNGKGKTKIGRASCRERVSSPV